MSEKKFFKNTRDQFIDGEPFKAGDVVEIEESRVEYLVAAGFLTETTAPKKPNKQANKQQEAAQAPAAEPAQAETPAADAPVAE